MIFGNSVWPLRATRRDPRYTLGLFGAPSAINATLYDKQLNRETNASLMSPEMKARFRDLGDTAFASQPAEFGKLLASETEKWGKVIRSANIKAD